MAFRGHIPSVHIDHHFALIVLCDSNMVPGGLVETVRRPFVCGTNMQLVATCFLATSHDACFDIVHARHCTLIDKGQATAGSTKDLTTKLALQRRSEPSFVGVLGEGSLTHARNCHRAIELGTILCVELV